MSLSDVLSGAPDHLPPLLLSGFANVPWSLFPDAGNARFNISSEKQSLSQTGVRI